MTRYGECGAEGQRERRRVETGASGHDLAHLYVGQLLVDLRVSITHSPALQAQVGCTFTSVSKSLTHAPSGFGNIREGYFYNQSTGLE